MPINPVSETYAIAEDTCPLTWDVWMPPGPGPFDVLLTIHGGGFTSNTDGSPQQANLCRDVSAGGTPTGAPARIAIAVQYRLCPDAGKWAKLPGQVADGRFPQQYNDCKRAVLAALAGTTPLLTGKVTGKVMLAGGSAGGTHCVRIGCDTNLQVTPVPWDASKRPLGILDFSGAHDFSDVPSQVQRQFAHKVANYSNVNPTNNYNPPYTDAQQMQLYAASPVVNVTSTSPPIFLSNGTTEAMPVGQYTKLVAALDAAGVTNYTAILDSDPTTGRAHSWARYPALRTQVLQWLNDVFTGVIGPGGGGSPPPGSTKPKGVCSLTSGRQSVPAAVLDNPDVSMVSIVEFWHKIEPTDGIYDYAYIDEQIKAVAAAGKKILLRVQTMGGAASQGGNTPDWVFDRMTVDRQTSYLAKIINGSTTLDLLTNSTNDFVRIDIAFKESDVDGHVEGVGIPPGTTIAAYVSPTRVTMSAPATSNTDLLTIRLPDRPAISKTVTTPGVTYSYVKKLGDNPIVFPVFWNPAFLRAKRDMYAHLADHIYNGTTLTPSEKAAIAVISVSIANASSEDWNVPSGTQEEIDAWLNSPDDPTNPGAGYDTNVLINRIVSNGQDSTFIDGVISNLGTNLFSRTAHFSAADVGKNLLFLVTGGQSFAITAVDSLSGIATIDPPFPTDTGAKFTFTMSARQEGTIDRAMALFPNQLLTMAIGGNGKVLDKAAADLVGDADINNFAARNGMDRARESYPGRQIAQINGLNARSPTKAEALAGSSHFKHLAQIADAGGDIAFQDLWFTFQDTTFRMNGGSNPSNLSDTQILENAATKASTYDSDIYIEVYDRDIENLLEAITFIRTLLVGDDEEPPPPPPGGGGGGTTPKLLPFLTIQEVNFRDEVLIPICDLLEISTRDGLQGVSQSRLDAIVRGINKHVQYAWRLWNWSEFEILEERAFAPIWNAIDLFNLNDRVFYLGDDETEPGYYDVILKNPPASVLPTNVDFYAPAVLTANDFFIALVQRCRRRIGDVMGIYASDPRANAISGPIQTLDWRLSNRGIEVGGYSASQTVFISYRAVPYKYTARVYDPAVSYKTGDLMFDLNFGGLVYRAIGPITGGIPPVQSLFGPVPFPSVLAQYVIYMTAADQADEVSTANQWRAMAVEFLGLEMDSKAEQTPTALYNFGRGRFGRRYSGLGVSGFGWSAVPPYTAPELTIGGSTITDACFNEWGDVIHGDVTSGGGLPGDGTPPPPDPIPDPPPDDTTIDELLAGSDTTILDLDN